MGSASFRFVRDEECATVVVSGDVEYENATELVDAFREVLLPHPHGLARVDLAGVGFLDSTGLTALLRCRQLALDEGTGFAVVNPSPLPLRVISVAGLAGTFGLEGYSDWGQS